MTANDAYEWLMEGAIGSHCDPFDIHVFASILALSFSEAIEAEPESVNSSGLSGRDLATIAQDMFPGIAGELVDRFKGTADQPDDEETSVRDLILMYGSGSAQLERPLAAMIARRCKQPHHLWQDLGLRNRGELSELMRRHFPRLAAKNNADMKWKKFLYRLICSSEGFTLCTSPVCSDCNEFEMCFGEEAGESLLARLRNSHDVAAQGSKIVA